MGDTGFEPSPKTLEKTPQTMERSISVATRDESAERDARLATIVAEWDALSEEDQADLWNTFQAARHDGRAARGHESPPRCPEGHQTAPALR